MMDKETLQKSLTSKAWGKIIRRSSLRGWKTFEEKEEKVKVLLKILHFAELEEPIPLLVPLLDLICESRPGFAVEMTCPCRPEPHLVSTAGFLLLEEVERSFSTTEQSLKKCSFGWYSDWFDDKLLSAVSSRMTRQKKEPVTNISATWLSVKDKRSVENFLTLLQAREVTVRNLDVQGFLEKDGWLPWEALAEALREKPNLVRTVQISRQDLKEPPDSIKEIWDSTRGGFKVCDPFYWFVKSFYDWDTMLKQIAVMGGEPTEVLLNTVVKDYNPEKYQ